MSSVNKVILVGPLGKDPDVRYTQDNTPVANISLATSQRWKDKNTNEFREETEWHKVIFYNRQAEVAEQYLKKGALIYIEGRLKTRKYTGQDGIDRYVTEIIADTLQMLGSRADNEQQDNSAFSSPSQSAPKQRPTNHSANAYAQAKAGSNRQAPPPTTSQGVGDMSDDVPF